MPRRREVQTRVPPDPKFKGRWTCPSSTYRGRWQEGAVERIIYGALDQIEKKVAGRPAGDLRRARNKHRRWSRPVEAASAVPTTRCRKCLPPAWHAWLGAEPVGARVAKNH